MAAAHKAKLLARKAAFEKTFRNVWGISPQGLSQVQMTVNDRETAEKLKKSLFAETAIADLQQNSDTVSTTSKNKDLLHTVFKGLLHVEKDQVRMNMVTTDDRVAEVIELAYDITKNPKLPVLVTTLHAAGGDYIAWVKQQAEANGDDDAFYNADPFDKSKAIAHEAVSKMEDHEKKEAAAEAKSPEELEAEAGAKAKEEEQAKEEEKADDEARKLKEGVADQAKVAAAKEAEEEAAAAEAKKANEKKGIFKTAEEAAAAQQSAPTAAQAAEKPDTDDLALYNFDLYEHTDY